MRRRWASRPVALSRAVGYYSAGTVELIVSGATHRQELLLPGDEHPAAGRASGDRGSDGLDLVEQMIRVAAGEPLGFTQDDVRLNGWAIETRVYAEDPYRGFLPSTGRLVRYRPPQATDGIRVDDGVREGGEVSMFYDPMIAKLITYADTREKAIDLQIAALDDFELAGIGHNIDFLSALMQHPRFRAGALTTGFIAEEYPDGFVSAPPSAELTRKLAALAATMSVYDVDRARSVDGQLGAPARAA
jgi:propionyl-CoA carboxylase alpha chain